MATIGDVTIRIGATPKQLEYDLRRAERSLQATATKFKTIGQNLTLGVTAPLAIAGAGAFKMASDVEESLNKVRVAFGDSAGSVEAFTNETLNMYGIARGTALDMAAFFGDMATSMGLPQEAAADMSKALVGLAGDVASFKNVPLAEVQTALGGIFTGETESLKRLGVAMQEENVKAFALAQGITKLYKDMTLAEKTTLRYQYVMDALRNSTGDFQRTNDGAANQMRIFQESVKELGAAFGQILLPVITPIIQGANRLLQSFRDLSPETKKLIVVGAALAAALGPALIVLGQMVTAVGALQIAAAKLGGGISLMGKYFLGLNPTVLAAAIALGALAGAAIAVYNAFNKVGTTQKAISDINQQVNKDLAKQKVQTDQLIKVVTDSNATLEDRKKALAQLQSIAPAYFNNLNVEKSSLNDINKAYATYIQALKDSARQKAIENKLVDLETQKLEIQERLTEAQKNYNIAQKNAIKGSAFEKSALQGVKKEYEEITKTINTLASQAKPVNVGVSTTATPTTIPTITGGADPVTLQDQIKGIKDRIEELSIAYAKKPTSGILQELNRQTDLLKSKEAIIENASQLAERVSGAGGGGAQNIPFIPSIADLESGIQTIQTFVTGKIKDFNKSVTDNIGDVSYSESAYSQFINQLGSDLDLIQARTDGGLISDNQADVERITLLNETLKRLQNEGFSPLSLEIQAVESQLENLGVKITETTTSDLTLALETTKVFTESFKTLMTDAFATVGESIGAAFAGQGKGMANFFGSILKLVTEFAKTFGKQLIALGTAKIGLEKLFAGVGGGLGAILAGTALIAIASAVQTNLAANLPSLAIGTDLVKSDGLAMLHRGEAVVPADVAKGGFSGAGFTRVIVEGSLMGNDIYLSNKRTEIEKVRTT